MADKKISQLTAYTTPLDADVLPIVDTASTVTKKVTWLNIKATLKTYFDTIYTTAGAVATQISSALSAYAPLNSPSLTTPTLGIAVATSINKVAITAPASSATITIADGKTLTVNNSIVFAGTDSTTMTFPSSSKSLAANDGTNWTFVSQAIGDIVAATSTTAYGRIAAVAVGSVLTSAGVGVAPAWSSAPQITSINLGHATDTTLARVAAGIMSIEGETLNGYATTATAAGTLTMSITSAKTQFFTGSTTHIVKLPTTSVIVGQKYRIVNNSTGVVTVQSSGANNIVLLGAGMSAVFTAISATPTTAAHWTFVLSHFTGINIAQTATSNAATVNLAYVTNTISNNSAATLTLTLPTAGAVDGMMRIVRVLDFSAVSQTIAWTNTENSTATAPLASNGSTTLPLTVGFMYNSATSKWRCVASA